MEFFYVFAVKSDMDAIRKIVVSSTLEKAREEARMERLMGWRTGRVRKMSHEDIAEAKEKARQGISVF